MPWSPSIFRSHSSSQLQFAAPNLDRAAVELRVPGELGALVEVDGGVVADLAEGELEPRDAGGVRHHEALEHHGGLRAAEGDRVSSSMLGTARHEASRTSATHCALAMSSSPMPSAAAARRTNGVPEGVMQLGIVEPARSSLDTVRLCLFGGSTPSTSAS